MAKKQSFINRLINIASVFVIIGAITAISILVTKYVQTVNENKKGPAVLTVLILAIIILLPLIPVIAVAFLIGAGVNEIIYRKQIRGK